MIAFLITGTQLDYLSNNLTLLKIYQGKLQWWGRHWEVHLPHFSAPSMPRMPPLVVYSFGWSVALILVSWAWQDEGTASPGSSAWVSLFFPLSPLDLWLIFQGPAQMSGITGTYKIFKVMTLCYGLRKHRPCLDHSLPGEVSWENAQLTMQSGKEESTS